MDAIRDKRRAGPASAARLPAPHLKPYATFLAACYLVAALVCVWLPNDLTRGFVLGAAGVGAPALLWGLVVQMSWTAPTMMGDTAEQWTAGELKRLRSSGWRLVNHFALGREDIDHLLFGPGGVYCVETKWSGSPWTDQAGRDRVMRAVEQVSTNTRRLSNWQPFRRAGLRAQPLVVLWGGALAPDDGLPAVRTVGPASVIAARGRLAGCVAALVALGVVVALNTTPGDADTI